MLPRRHAPSQDGVMAARITGVVVAGGASRRMGADKCRLLIDGEPMLRRVAAKVASVPDELLVMVARDRPVPPGLLDGLGARMVIDRRADAGPLAGMESGFLAAGAEHALVVAGRIPSAAGR
jgi:molybdenum cofactor guanylyltransferase